MRMRSTLKQFLGLRPSRSRRDRTVKQPPKTVTPIRRIVRIDSSPSPLDLRVAEIFTRLGSMNECNWGYFASHAFAATLAALAGIPPAANTEPKLRGAVKNHCELAARIRQRLRKLKEKAATGRTDEHGSCCIRTSPREPVADFYTRSRLLPTRFLYSLLQLGKQGNFRFVHTAPPHGPPQVIRTGRLRIVDRENVLRTALLHGQDHVRFRRAIHHDVMPPLLNGILHRRDCLPVLRKQSRIELIAVIRRHVHIFRVDQCPRERLLVIRRSGYRCNYRQHQSKRHQSCPSHKLPPSS